MWATGHLPLLCYVLFSSLAVSQVVGIPGKTSVLVHKDSKKVALDSVSGTSSFPENYAVLTHVPGPPASPPYRENVTTVQPSSLHSSAVLSRKAVFISSMTFVTGFVDVICYRRYKCFVNMMTGNCIRFATALAENRWMDSLFYISLIASYSVGVGIFRALDLKLRPEGHHHRRTSSLTATEDGESPPSQTLTVLAATAAPLVAMTLFVLADCVLHFFDDNRTHAPLLSMGFGVVNAASAEATGGTIMYAMTGHIHKMAKSMVDYWMLSKRPRALKSVKGHLRVVAWFVLGIGLSVKASQHHMLLFMSELRIPMATSAGAVFCMLLVWYNGSAPRT